ncbi:bacteriohemerythrin [Campylobacter sp. RM10532]|uniref:Bacteriohemerythrin n=1 Tax=Campylobacter molothri TaxID=1032242 RepID=A0ACC5W216_9BACT|nr:MULTISPECIES: hemerythrin domain-containing protein [unclassified Campylobacter]MBZ7929012.1 bacteriohemerythrin [Campylobacter sp. RM10542]MBZ7930388.1 bacteriohemerythrin [Campylobacter sp. W0067]MBZ7931893.1 bacteriohemerythrin [Campylobacter sp. RM12910]MBZ7934854.1 bacteriohemerythrin [Campylobacter sp. W0065]MBZ7937930.1 bacteriohemerythrin [Campylobacter sp. RM10538]MBZ7945754.1 bacteriohemerythrin [Campylobacter sp. RM10532]MBZ7946983.1 bacteriohemerythrin [Campylobacter sp. RM105
MISNQKIVSMNNELLDSQHQDIFEISIKLSLMNHRHINSKELKEVLKELLVMLNRHFSDEEAFMREINYPFIKEHMKIHRSIIFEIEEIIVREARTIHVLTEKLDLVVRDFIINHTSKEDSKITKYYEKKLKNLI